MSVSITRKNALFDELPPGCIPLTMINIVIAAVRASGHPIEKQIRCTSTMLNAALMANFILSESPKENHTASSCQKSLFTSLVLLFNYLSLCFYFLFLRTITEAVNPNRRLISSGNLSSLILTGILCARRIH